MRELRTTTYDYSKHSDENMLLNFGLVSAPDLMPNITHLYGMDSDKFPLLSLTEGQGFSRSMKPLQVGDTQYTWNVMGRMKHTSRIMGLVDASLTTPGLGYQSFEVIMEDELFIKDYGVMAPDGEWMGRIQGEPRPHGKYFIYTFSPQGGGGVDEFCALTNFTAGNYWVLMAPTIAASMSDGNRSNKRAPGKMTNQFGYHRFSSNIAGNLANKVVEIELDLEGGGKTNQWFPFEWKDFELDKRMYLEEDLYYSTYNRDEHGVINLKDERTGLPIPRGAGIRQIVKEVGNFDTYSGALTLQKIDGMIDAIFNNRVDDDVTEIVMYGGKGARRMWNNAMLADAKTNQYFTPLGEQVIQGGEYLTYGKYFDQYKTIDGKLITFKSSKVFDSGLKAEMQKENGLMYNGLPLNSYTLMALDMSNKSDGRNIQMVCEEGRESNIGIYKGMAPLPGAWGSFGNMISTKEDVASYEHISSQGVCFTNPTTSFWMELAL